MFERKIRTVPWRTLDPPESICIVIDGRNIKKHGYTAAGIAGLTIIIFTGFPDMAFAADSQIDAGGRRIYEKILNVGKWVLLIKGGIETIKLSADGDHETAKKKFFSYLIIYAILWALPWGMDEIEKLFDGEDSL